MYALTHVLLFFFVLLTCIYFVYILSHLISWIRLPISTMSENYVAKTKISLVIAARNEESTITNCLNSIAVQTYPASLLEVIVVDDHSTDSTMEVAEKAFSQIKIVGKCISNPENVNGKKAALTEGIKNSSGELIVITDADCAADKDWLSTIENEYQKIGACMLCGPVKIENEAGVLGQFQSLELCGLSLLSGAGINADIPLLCNGANIAYTRKVFNEVDGFKGIDGSPSGDDTLLMFKIHKKYPGKIRYVKSKEAFVSTSAQTSLKNFLSQRIRWASKGLYSKSVLNSLVSMLVFTSNFFSFLAIIALVACGRLVPLLGVGIILKIVADFLLLFFATGFFNKRKLLWIFPIAEVITMLYISYIGIVANFSSYSWKGRNYKRPS